MSTADRRERRNHFRGKPRPGRRVDVAFAVGDTVPQQAYTRNIGVGGAFIVTPTPAHPGTPLVLSIRVPNTLSPLQLRGEVRWNTPGEADDPPGMGVKFQALDVEQLLQLSEYFASLTGRDEATS
jgi:uncharacterized protein (TIGR02266 family)